MQDRLKQFLAMENLTPARFAEVMGIQRSGISHLLAGRNKPSFEFIQKMMTAYPDLNIEWLILGKGRPYKSDAKQPSLPAETLLLTDFPEEETPSETDLFSDYQNFEPQKEANQPAENPKMAAETIAPLPKSNKRISRIIVFYNDGTYEEK